MMCNRKLASGVAAAAMLVAIAGCGGAKPARSGAAEPGTAPPASINEQTSPPTTAPPAVPNGEGPAPAATAPATTPPAGGTNSQPPAAVTQPPQQPPAPAAQPPQQPPARSTTPAPQPTAPTKPTAPTPPAPPATTPPSSASGDLAFTTVARGQQSSGRARNAVLVSSETSLNAQGIRPTQAVDFNQEAVLVVYMGEQNTGGYSVEITSVKLEGGKLLVTVKQSRPSPNSMVTQALTQPYHAVKIPKVPAGTQVSVNWL